MDYQGIEGVIGHEYFHNWTGNRVTCRDWFQLTLKEGLTVFRDQEFTADMTSRAVKRIDDVSRLRDLTRSVVVPRLLGVSGVADVNVFGGEHRALIVTPVAAALERH